MIQHGENLKKREASFYANKICPYCQRVQILLVDAGIAYDRTEVDFTVSSSWLANLTPIGKIPILVDGEYVIFGSGVILEYLNESCGNRYLPQNIKERAVVRSWCTVVDRIHDDICTYFSTKTESEFDVVWKRVCEQLTRLVESSESYAFSGKNITILGIYVSPLFVLLQTLSECARDFFPPASSTAQLSHRLLNNPAVILTNDVYYRSRLLRFLLSADSHFARVAAHMKNEIFDNDGAQELKAAGYLTPADQKNKP